MNALKIKAAVRARDGHVCTRCGMTAAEHRARTGRTLEVHRRLPGSPYTVDGCVTLCRGCHGKEQKSPPGPGEVVYLDRVSAAMASYLAAIEGKSTADWLSEVLRPIVEDKLAGRAS